MIPSKAQKGQEPKAAPAGPRPGGTGDAEEKQRQAKEREAEMRNGLLSQVLTQEARARLATIAAANPERAQLIENIIIQNVQMGAIRGKVDEENLKGLLEKVTEQAPRKTVTVHYERRRVFDDSDDDFEDE